MKGKGNYMNGISTHGFSGNVREAKVIAPTGTYIGNFDGKVESYLGVRYAAPAVNFKAPKDVTTTSNDVIDATKFGPAGLQPLQAMATPSHFPMSSDNLTLNIWTKDTGTTASKPVMMWIHGGTFTIGGASNEPSTYGRNFAANLPDGEDVVMISVNYRLGILGQIDLSVLDDYDKYKEEYPDHNNIWILDLIQALKWINKNIAGFGGDPENITVFGQSCGGMSSFHLCMLKEAKVKRAIIHSGSPFMGVGNFPSYRAASKGAFDALEVSTVAALVKLPDEFILSKMNDPATFYATSYALRERVMDGRVISPTWWDDFKAGAAKDVDIMCGCPNGEGENMFVDGRYPEIMTAKEIMERDLVGCFGEREGSPYWVGPQDTDGLRTLMEEALAIEDERKSADRMGHIRCYFDSYLGNRYICEEQSKWNTNIYQYSFDWAPDIHAISDGSLPEEAGFSPFGRGLHCAEIPVVFDTCEEGYKGYANYWTGRLTMADGTRVADKLTGKYRPEKVPLNLIKQMQAAWYAFAKTGNPNNKLIPEWKPNIANERNVMVINDEGWKLIPNLQERDLALLSDIQPER